MREVRGPLRWLATRQRSKEGRPPVIRLVRSEAGGAKPDPTRLEDGVGVDEDGGHSSVVSMLVQKRRRRLAAVWRPDSSALAEVWKALLRRRFHLGAMEATFSTMNAAFALARERMESARTTSAKRLDLDPVSPFFWPCELRSCQGNPAKRIQSSAPR